MPAAGPEPDHKASIGASHLDSITAVGSSTAVLSIKADEIKDTSKIEPEPDEIVDVTPDPDRFRYKTAMTYYLQGNLDEAMTRFTQLTADTVSRYRELAHYQLAMCFKYKRQKAKARHVLKELVNINGRMKRRAQLALNKL